MSELILTSSSQSAVNTIDLFNDISWPGYRKMHSIEKLDGVWTINWKGGGSSRLPANFRCYSSTSWKDYDKHHSEADFNPGPRKHDSSVTQKTALSITCMHRLSTLHLMTIIWREPSRKLRKIYIRQGPITHRFLKISWQFRSPRQIL